MVEKTSDLKRLQLAEALSQFPPSESATPPRGGWVRALREALGMTQAELAARLDITRQSLQGLETAEAERRVTLDSLDRMARAMECRVVYAVVPESGTLADLRGRKLSAKQSDFQFGGDAAKSSPQPAAAKTAARATVAPAGSKPVTEKLRISQPRLEALCRKYGIARLSLFGSASRNELRPDSDVDLMVEFAADSHATPADIPAMQGDFSVAFSGRKVDMVTPRILGNPIRRDAILADLKLIYPL
jgi:predicted DNA-binding mobile mystery protein A